MRSLSLFDLAFLAPKGIPILDIPGDDFESYADGVNLNGLNGGWGGINPTLLSWAGAYVGEHNYFGCQAHDDFESYGDGVGLNGLNAGAGFSGAFVDHSY